MRRSKAQEKKTAKIYGGTLQPGSGNGIVKKHDVRSPKYLIENKTKARADAKSITIKGVDLVSVVNKAAREGRTGMLQFDLMGRRWCILEECDVETD
jgi:hypothetical protein